METNQSTAGQRLTQLAMRKAKLENALDACGIGHNVNDMLRPVFERSADFCASIQKRVCGQAVHNAIYNVPMGVQTLAEGYSPERVLRTAIAGACGELVKWDVIEAMELAADILEDVNAHPEAKILRDMARKEETRLDVVE